MSDISLLQLANSLGVNTVSGIAQKKGYQWPPPPHHFHSQCGFVLSELQIEHGSFLHRPRPWLKYCFVPVEHRWPIGLIYAAAASLWAYLFTTALVQNGLIWLKFAAPAVVIACWQGLRCIEKDREEKQKEAVKCLMTQILGSNDAKLDDSQGELVKTIKKQPILGIDNDKATRRLAYHWKGNEQRQNSRAASALLSAVIDLPARWIEDVWSGRR